MVERLTTTGRLVPLPGGAGHPDARRGRAHPRGAAPVASTRSPSWWRHGSPLVPRYRQRVAEVPGHLANPVWVDDPDFDIAYHVRRNGAAPPGHRGAAAGPGLPADLAPAGPHPPAVGDVPGRRAGRRRVAVVTKTHPALVDGLSAIDIGQVLLDVGPGRAGAGAEPSGARSGRRPARSWSWQALDEYARRPSAIVDTARGRGHRRPVDRRPADRGRRRPAADRPDDDAPGARTAR